MTGFGREEFQLAEFQCVIEMRSLNGKQFEYNSKISSLLKPYEIEIRNIIQKKLQRGSIELNIFLKQNGSSKPMMINTDLAVNYYHTIVQIAEELNLEKKDILSSLLRMPEIVTAVSDPIDEKHWDEIKLKIENVCDNLIQHREREGMMLEKTIIQNIEKIKELCESVNPYEKNRIEKMPFQCCPR